MTTPHETLEKPAFLPEGLGEAARRRLSQGVGLVLLLVGSALFLALLSYDAADPSLNRATGRAPENLLGLPGAYLADLLLQTVGLAAIAPAAVLWAWGWRLMTHAALTQFWLRLSALCAGMLLLAIAAAAPAAPEAWPIGGGLGGLGGVVLLDRMANLARALFGEFGAILVACAALLGALAMLLYALSLSARDWGGLLHWGLWYWGRAKWLARGAVAAVREAGLGTRGKALAGAAGVHGRTAGAALRGAASGLRERLARPLDPDLEEPYAPVATPGVFTPPPIMGLAPEANPAPVEAAPAPAPRDPPAAEPRAPAAPAAPAPAPVALTRARIDIPAPPPPRPAAPIHAPAPVAYAPPPLKLLTPPQSGSEDLNADEASLRLRASQLESVLEEFGIKGEIVRVRPGPVVTLFELEPAPGTKNNRVIGLSDDIARSMSAVSVRIAVVPGRNVIGIELPNPERQIVLLRSLLSKPEHADTSTRLPLVLGKDIGGAPVVADLARMPHLLVAGTTGSGKSVAINTMILSLIYRMSPEQCRFIMVDPKMLELSVYNDIPHLLTPVVTDPGKAVVALKWAVREMEDRYRKMSLLGVRNVQNFNTRVAEARRRGENLSRNVQTGFDAETGRPIYEEQPLSLEPLPYIVVVVDEMADLMLVAGKDIEAAIQRLAQMARAAGIHLIMATQRPSVDVITGTIKANFPTRISFQVTSKIDSRTILGEQGAEQLLGAGDMLYMAGGGRITRVHGPFVNDREVEAIVDHLKTQGVPDYIHSITEEDGAGDPGAGGQPGLEDPLFDEAVALVAREGRASTSFIQRHLQIGYNRAARIIEAMEADGIVGPPNHVGKREILARPSEADALA